MIYMMFCTCIVFYAWPSFPAFRDLPFKHLMFPLFQTFYFQPVYMHFLSYLRWIEINFGFCTQFRVKGVWTFKRFFIQYSDRNYLLNLFYVRSRKYKVTWNWDPCALIKPVLLYGHLSEFYSFLYSTTPTSNNLYLIHVHVLS